MSFNFRLDVGVTGARIGDVLIGIQKCTTDAMIRVYEQEVYPLKKRLDTLREDTDVWKKFLDQLGTIAYFSKMTITERATWLEEKQTSIEFLGDDNPGIQLEILQTGESDLNTRVEQDQLDRLLNGKEGSETGHWTNVEIEGFLPKNPGGGQVRKHTLFFLKWFWKIAVDHHKVSSFKGITYDIEKGLVYSDYKENKEEDIIVIDDITSEVSKVKETWKKTKSQQIGFVVPRESLVLNDENMNNLTVEIIQESSSYTSQQIRSWIPLIRSSLKGYTAASYKSLLQKLIRFGAPMVRFDHCIVDAQVVLVTCLCMLAQNPGSFVPDIQRFVTGLESLAKRIGIVCGFEDVYCSKPCDLLSLFAGGLLCQRVRSWRPSWKILKQWILTACRAQKEDRACVYDHHKGWEMEPYIISLKLTAIQHCSAILEILKTYPGDIGMCRDIAKNYQTLKTVSRNKEEIKKAIMPIYHGVDHHWSTGVAYFYTPQTIMKICGQKSMEDDSFLLLSTNTFGLLYRELFRKVSGYNPRRHSEYQADTFENDPFVQETRRAQALYMLAKQVIPTERQEQSQTYTLVHTLDNSWLAGLVGAIQVPGTPAALVTLRADDINQLVAIRKPSRSMEEHITVQREEQAKTQARTILKEGIKLRGTSTLSDFLHGSIVYLTDDGEYYIKKGNIKKSWEEARQITITIPYHTAIKKEMEMALNFCGKGIEVNCWESLDILISDTVNEHILRALSYVSTYKMSFEMYRISRDGNGTNYAVSINDIGAFQFLLTLSQIFPCALKPGAGFPQKFTVPIAPMLWKVIEYIQKQITHPEEHQGWENKIIVDKLGREPWEHQIDSVKEMIKNHQQNCKGNFIFMKVGMGKSLIVMRYLSYLHVHSELPKYVVYTLPASAIASVIHEIRAFRLDVNYIIPLKSIKNKVIPNGVNVSQKCILQEGVINLIEHDHLRRCGDELIKKANQCLFIVDEVHKTLNETKRTSTALEISHLCREFIVLTGTPIIDNKIYKLIGWLEQIVQFEVNEQNFWVSANSLVARKVTTGIKVNRNELSCQSEFTKNEMTSYKSLVPFKMGGENTYPTIETFNDAVKICYDVVSRKIVSETMKWLNVNRGVMIVAQNKAHQTKLQEMLIDKGVKNKDIFLLTGKESIFLTDESVKQKKSPVPDYKVVIVTIHKSEGYTLTRLSVMITSVYPSNQANREQLEGRINRISQKKDIIDIQIIHCGILTLILKHHNSAKSLSIALSDMVKSI